MALRLAGRKLAGRLKEMIRTPVPPQAYPHKPRPTRIAIFGAAARMGGAVADYLAYAEPAVGLRLLSSSAAKLAAISSHFPHAEIMEADYLAADSLRTGLDGVDAIFVVTPSGLDERAAMGNLINVARELGSIRHIVRVVGYEPEATLARVPAKLAARNGDGTQHFIAKAMLDESGLPVTFLNCGATLMDNFTWFSRPIAERDLFVYPPRFVPFVDVRDFGEVAARVLMSDDARHIGQFHTVNNGYDQLESPQVAQMLADVLRRCIAYDGSREGFLREYGPGMDARHAGEAEYRWDFLEYEYSNSLSWALNNFAERTLGRRPNTLRSWIMEHRALFMPPC